RDVLARDPRSVAAMLGVAALNGADRARESRELMLRAVEIDPKNRAAYYTLGTLDWQLAYKAIDAARREARIVPFTTQLPDPAVRQSLRREWMPYLEEAFRVLQIARELDAADSSAAAYLGLVARANAMIAESPAEAQALIRQSDESVA